jgi:Tol biopolymer transport system component
MILLIGGGLLLLLCVAGLVGLGYYLGQAGQTAPPIEPVAATAEPPTAEPPAAAVVVEVNSAEPATVAPSDPAAEPTEVTDAAADAVEPEAGPEIGGLVFASAVDGTGEPLDPGDSFAAGLTEIHAIFDYENMQPDYLWERVWSLDGEEMLRSQETWGGDEAGQFDYFLDTEGAPLPSGRWQLELYVEQELAATGSFTIEPDSLAATTEPTAEPTLEPTAEPAAEPTAKPAPVRANPVRSSNVYRLAYSVWDGGAYNLYLADTNGQNQQFILSRAAGPSWSVDGQQLFFYGQQGVTQQFRQGRVECEFGTISDGIVAIDLTSPPGNICRDRPGPWFCERKQIDLQSPPSDVCEQGGVRIFQNLDWKEGSARWASVAPDGRAVAFDARPGGDYRIYFRSIFDTQQFRFELAGEQGDWSPDGQRLVYRSGRDNKAGLWISNRDDTGHTNVTQDGSDAFPAWSPDGSTLAFSRTLYGNQDIYLVNVDGSNLRRLTEDPGHDVLPTFTPDGQLIFRSDRSGAWAIWKMAGDGGGQVEIIATAGLGSDWTSGKMDVR